MTPHALAQILIERFCYSPFGTFGHLTGAGLALYTVERPWAGNAEKISCIPEGTYRCKRGVFPKFKETFQVMDVPGRSAILFHVGNTLVDFEGCIGVGLDLGWINESWGVTGSRLAFRQFMAALNEHETFGLQITQFRPSP